MATDYTILEQELTDLKRKLERDLHMNKVRRLHKKQNDLAKFVIQRKQIENLSKQVKDLESTVSTVYCPQHALKDNEIQGYLVYLLQMKDYFKREVETKKEIIKQTDSQIEIANRELCVSVNERAKVKKNMPIKSAEFVRLENMSDRLNQMNKRICTMRQENKEIMENIVDMRKFQKQFKVFEKDFRRKINYFKDKAHSLLEDAVCAYEEKDEFMNKEKSFQERAAQDKRKTTVNENALNLHLQKTEKNKAFAELQDTSRTDIRIAETAEMIEKNITGLEPNMEKMKKLQTDITAAAAKVGKDGKDEADEEDVEDEKDEKDEKDKKDQKDEKRIMDPEKMEERFKLSGDKTDKLFSYLDERLKDMNYLETEIDNLKKQIRKSNSFLSSADKKMRKKLASNKEEADKKLEKADEVSNLTDESKINLNTMLDQVKSLYLKCCPEDAESLEDRPLDDSNVIDYLQKMEKQILDYLICLECLKIKELSEEETPIMLEKEKNDEVDDQAEAAEKSDLDQSQLILNELEKSEDDEMECEKILTFEELKEKVVTALSDVDLKKDNNERED